jgi:hypothetical protein
MVNNTGVVSELSTNNTFSIISPTDDEYVASLDPFRSTIGFCVCCTETNDSVLEF